MSNQKEKFSCYNWKSILRFDFLLTKTQPVCVLCLSVEAFWYKRLLPKILFISPLMYLFTHKKTNIWLMFLWRKSWIKICICWIQYFGKCPNGQTETFGRFFFEKQKGFLKEKIIKLTLSYRTTCKLLQY